MKYFNQVQNLEDRELSYVEEVTGAAPGAAPTLVTQGVDCTGYASIFVRLTCDQATAAGVTVSVTPWYWSRTQVGTTPATDTDAWLPGETFTLDALDDAGANGQTGHLSCAEGDRIYLQVVPSGSGLGWANIEAFAALSRTEVMTAYTLGASSGVAGGGGGTPASEAVYQRVTATGAGAIAATFPSGSHNFKLSGIRLHLSGVPTTSEDFTITMDDVTGAAYDTALYSDDLSVGSTVDLYYSEPVIGQAGDVIDIAFPNTETNTYGLTIIGEIW